MRYEAAALGGFLQWYGHPDHRLNLVCGLCLARTDESTDDGWIRLTRQGALWRLERWPEALACDGECGRSLDDEEPRKRRV